MRIGSTIIDTDNMSVAELEMLINELSAIRTRKREAQELESRMDELLMEAKEKNFIFIDKYTGQELPREDIKIFDKQ